ncbi:hypothetical protein OROMI_025845 [Orobanche minor]
MDTVGSVKLWEITKGVVIEDYGEVSFEKKKEELFEMVSKVFQRGSLWIPGLEACLYIWIFSIWLNPSVNHAQKDLPITIFESGWQVQVNLAKSENNSYNNTELHIIDAIPQLIFVRSSYSIEIVEAEHILVDHVAHLKPSDGGSAASQLINLARETLKGSMYVQLTNEIGSTVNTPVTVQISVTSERGGIVPQRLNQLAKIITGSPSKNLGLDNSVSGKVKQISLSSYLKNTLHASVRTPSHAPSPGGNDYAEPSHPPDIIFFMVVLLFGTDISEYPLIAPLKSYGRGTDTQGGRYASHVFGTNLTDVVITGENGMIDGQGAYWWDKFLSKELNFTRPYLIEIMYSW